MNTSIRIISVAATIFVVATLSLSAQSYIGPYFAYGISTSVGTSVSAYGAPSRIAVGALYSRTISSGAELNVHGFYRMESGGAKTTPPDPLGLGRPSGMLNVVEPGAGGPRVITTLDATALEIGATLAFRVAELDSTGSAIQLQLGVYGDRLFSVSQTDDYSELPKEQLGDRPLTVRGTYDAQIGFGAIVGARMVLPVDASRILIDVSYIVRQPTTIENQDIGWLVGRGLRLGVGFQF